MAAPWLAYLKVEDLHEEYAGMAAVIGLELTVTFAEDWYGGTLELPRVGEISHPDHLRSGYHDIYHVTGSLELTNAVAQQLGGGRLYLPQARHALLAAKERYIIANDRVDNRRQLARDTGLSLRHVYRVCQQKTADRRARRRKWDVDPDQLSFL